MRARVMASRVGLDGRGVVECEGINEAEQGLVSVRRECKEVDHFFF